MSCRVKICGITSLDDALYAVNEGADALGFVFYEQSPRYVAPDVANAIVSQLPPFVIPVGLFVNATPDLVSSVVQGNARWIAQFHGDETAEECESHSVPYYKALRMKQDIDLFAELERYSSSLAILLDAYKHGVPGGTGETFNWELIPKKLSKPIILAGGLTPSNVKAAIAKVKPYAVDVSGGVEQSKGVKDRGKVAQFIYNAKH